MRDEDFSIGYYLMLEGVENPNELLDFALRAERSGFKYLGASDHFHPWRDQETYSTFPWTWLSTVLEKTKNMIVGTGVTCPILRYHPGIVAQAFASMDYMYPGRVFLSVGTGESLNEAPLGFKWPSYSERKERLIEAISVIKKLWSGNFVDFEGKYYSLKKAKLYTPPKTNIPLYVAASGPKSSEMAGKYGDGLYTILPSTDEAVDVLLSSFEEGAEKVDRDPDYMEKIAQVEISYSENYAEALNACRPNSSAIFDYFFEKGYNPKEGDKLEKKVSESQLKEKNKIVKTPQELVSYCEKVFQTGFTKILINSKSPDEEDFINICNNEVFPYFAEKRSIE